MENLFQKLLYAGVGLASQTTEKFEKSLDDLVKKGKLSDTEAKKLVDELIERTSTAREEFEERFKAVADKVGFKKTTNELEELKKRVEELEAKLAEKTSKAKAAATN